jgi:phosphoribosylanthranilate isomerase
MFRIKICGITRPEDALVAAEAGADAIGLNFFPRSKRHVGVERAAEIAAVLPPGIVKVGVFVDAEPRAIEAAHDAVRFDLLQLHGGEPPEYLAALHDSGLANLPVVRALACGGTLTHVEEYLDRCRDLGCLPRAVLLDAAVPGAQGGTGVTCDWGAAARYHEVPAAPPLVLAGGLTASNVAAAIATVRPAAVDVASGVESGPGRKDAEQVRRFVAAARAAAAWSDSVSRDDSS